MRAIIFFGLLTVFGRLSAQDGVYDTYDTELFLKVDNDAFLTQTIDRYYSSGIFLQYRKLVTGNSFLSRMGGEAKAIRSFQFAHVFYTSQDLRLRTIDQFDRPYAGYMSFAYGVDYFFNNSGSLKFNFEGGILGPLAKMGEFQKWYHKIIDARIPRGWRYQIENTPLIQLKSEYSARLIAKNKFDLYNESEVNLGTVFDNLRQGISVRWGNFLPLNQSSFKSAKLGVLGKDNPEESFYRESYFFATGQIEFVGFNATVQGNFIGKESIHTEQVQRVRYLVKYGWMLGFYRWDLAVSINNVGSETQESQDHYFITFDVVRRL